jgi:hypothetical protein
MIAFPRQACPGFCHTQEVRAALWCQLRIGRKLSALGFFGQAVVRVDARSRLWHDSSGCADTQSQSEQNSSLPENIHIQRRVGVTVW